MTIKYKGESKDFKFRRADIEFDAETEQVLADRMEFFLDKVKGYAIIPTGVEGCIQVEVYDRDEYKELVKDYKEAKKMITSGSCGEEYWY